MNGNNGGIFKSDIQNCWFENWGFITNTGYVYTGNLCPINIQENYGGDETHIDNCQFYFVDSIYWATDHGNISRSLYASIGYNNQWPLTSPFSVGAAVILGESSSGLSNGNENWVFEKSYMDGAGPCITFLDTRLNPPYQTVEMSRDDASEDYFLKFLTLSNSTCAWQCQTPYPYGTNYMVMTNSSGNWVVTSVKATNVFFGYSGMFSGNGAGLTSLNGSQVTSGTVPLEQMPSQVTTNGQPVLTLGTWNITTNYNIGALQITNVLTASNAITIYANGSVSYAGNVTNKGIYNGTFSVNGNGAVADNLITISSFGTLAAANSSANIGTSGTPFGNIYATNYNGNGSGLTNIPALSINYPLTNTTTAVALNATNLWTLATTNTSFTFASAIAGVNPNAVNLPELDITNNSGSLITITAPASWKTVGTWNCTNLTRFFF